MGNAAEFLGSPLQENIAESLDASFGMQRTGVSCRRREAHLGHMFEDGPRRSGLRSG